MNQTRLLSDRYEVGDVLGRGGMATVRKARDLRLGRDVAVKELRIDLASDSTFQARFRREAQASAGLNHPNIVAVYDTGEELDPISHVSVPFIVMELILGRTLRDVLRDGRPILPRRALEFTLGVLEALSYSHTAGIVHRDIKPANVMITSTGTVKVMDFGIARAVSDTSSTMTQTAAVIGTAQYLSPEQARGETVDARSDIYSAGCLLYELLVGRPPFTGDSPVSVAYQHVRELPVAPSQLDAEVTPDMDAVVLRALAKSPQDRYQSASEMAADIRRMLAGQPIEATPPPVVPAVAVLPPGTPPAGTAVSAPTAVYGAYPGYGQVADPGSTGAMTVITAPVPAKRRGGWLWPVITGILLVAVVAGTLFLVLMPKKIQVPQVKGFEPVAAQQLIQARNLNPVVKQTQGPNDSTVNRVIDQDPAAGTQVDPASNVTITVNIGPTMTVVPAGLVGLDVTAAKAKLTQQGFTTVDAQPAVTEPAAAKANQVLTVDPVEGTPVAAGTKITLYYATGKAAVPNLRTYECNQAAALAKSLGFTSVVIKDRADGGTVAGNVIDTTPLPTVVANKADTLTIYCAVAPPITPTVTITTTTTPSTPAVSASGSPSP